MSRKTRLCAFFSRGPHFLRMLRALRAGHPDAEIVAVVPPGFPEDVIGELADITLFTAVPAVGPGRFRALPGLLRQLRAERFTRMVVMFDSPRLRVVARLSGIPERWCFGPDGNYAPMGSAGLLGAMVSGVARRARGWLTWLRIWWVVRTTRIKP